MVSPPSNARVPTMRLAAATCVLLTAVSPAHGQAPAPPSSPDPLAARAKGRPDAPVTVYEMSDFQCPYCRSFALTTMPLLEKEYVQTGEVREDAARAGAAGAVSTPTFYIEGGLLEGAAPVEVFRAVLDSVYRSKTTDRAR